MPAPESIPMREGLATAAATGIGPVPPPMKSADETAALPHVIPAPGAVPTVPIQKKPQDNWFGGSYDDDDDVAGIFSPIQAPTSAAASASTTAAEQEENFMAYTGSDAVEGEYSLLPDFAKTFTGTGLDKAGGKALPDPVMTDFWKPLSPSGARSSFFEHLPAAAPAPARSQADLQGQMATILRRLEDLEVRGSAPQQPQPSENSDMEILMFTMSGIFVMFLMDVLVRGGGRR